MATQAIKLDRPKIQSARLRIVGVSPLITHRFSEKAKKQIRDKKAGNKKKNRDVTDPEAEFMEACYFLSDGGYGFPVTGLKDCIRRGGHKDLGIPMTLVSRGFFIHADESDLIRIDCEAGPKMREDPVRVGMGSTDLRYRPEFSRWGMTINFEFDTEWLTLETIAALVERGGFGIGIGEWRPEKGGEYGRFKLAEDQS